MTWFCSYPSTRGTSFKMRLTTCNRASRRREERSSSASGTPTPTPKAAATIRRPQTANHCLQSSSSPAANSQVPQFQQLSLCLSTTSNCGTSHSFPHGTYQCHCLWSSLGSSPYQNYCSESSFFLYCYYLLLAQHVAVRAHLPSF
jgi:hypothetical protein